MAHFLPVKATTHESSGSNMDLQGNVADEIQRTSFIGTAHLSYLLNIVLLAVLMGMLSLRDSSLNLVDNKACLSLQPKVDTCNCSIIQQFSLLSGSTTPPSTAPQSSNTTVSIASSSSSTSKSNVWYNEYVLSALAGKEDILVSVNQTIDGSTKEYYLIINGVSRRVPDKESFNSLVGYMSSQTPQLDIDNATLALFKSDTPVPPLPRSDPDLVLSSYLTTIRLFQAEAIQEYRYLGQYVNPCVVRWKNETIMSSSLDKDVLRLWRFVGDKTVEMNIVGREKLPNLQDARLFFLSNESDFLLASFTISLSRPFAIGLARIALFYNGSEATASVLWVHRTIPPPEHIGEPQKNWSPFEYDGKLHYIQNINPLRIYRPILGEELTKVGVDGVHLEMISESPEVLLPWVLDSRSAGAHGGTPARRIDGCCYLSFFHSKTLLPNAPESTYFTGAFTFSLSPPFKLLNTTVFPIVNDFFYTGEWVPYRNRRLDYVVFPMCYDGIQLNKSTGIMHANVSIGHRDFDGYELLVDVSTVMNSMKPVSPKV